MMGLMMGLESVQPAPVLLWYQTMFHCLHHRR
jgi:hypothetical protein